MSGRENPRQQRECRILADADPPETGEGGGEGEVAPPIGPGPPQWDGREETLEAYMRQAKAYAALRKETTAPMETRDKRKDLESTFKSPRSLSPRQK